MKRLLLIGVLGLSACGDPVTPSSTATAPTAPAAAPAAAVAPAAPPPAQPTGPAAPVAAITGQETAAQVTRVQALTGDDAKVFSTAGGDPAANGLVTYLALSGGAVEGWKVFPIGDFNDWQIVEQAKGRVVLKVNRSAVDPAKGQIATGDALLIVSVPAFTADEITITPAA